MNQCHFLGNLTRDPEVRETKSGLKVVNFTIGVNSPGKGGKKETAFIRCEAWDTGAEMIGKYFRKGSPIIVHCSVRDEEWTDKDGNKRYGQTYRVSKFEFVPGHKYASLDDGQPTPAPDARPADGGGDGDPIPF